MHEEWLEAYWKGVNLMDTSPEANETYFRRLTEMTPSERLRNGVALWRAGDSLQHSATRRMHPTADEAEITFRIAATRFGAELARKAYGR
jgi:Rv0078B-related antitoxin